MGNECREKADKDGQTDIDTKTGIKKNGKKERVREIRQVTNAMV